MKWCYRFLKRWSYTIRRATHVGRKIKVKALDDLANFYLILKDIKLKQKIFLESDHRRIWNCDETAIWLDLVKGTSVEKIGAKSVPIHTFGNEKVRISVLLCFNALSEKLPPFIIAKAKEGKTTENRLKKLSCVTKGDSYYKMQRKRIDGKRIF